jgi:hypothetical protein
MNKIKNMERTENSGGLMLKIDNLSVMINGKTFWKRSALR